MKTRTHRAKIKRRRAQAIGLSLAGTAVLVLGLVLNFQSRFGAAYVALLLGTIMSWLGISLSERWVARPRADVALNKGLGGLQGRPYALYHWLLPADHVLAAPWGLVIFFVHNHDGPVVVEEGRWRDARSLGRRMLRFARRPVRHPEPVIRLEVEGLREALERLDPELAGLPIEAAALFSNPSVALERRAESPDPPALLTEELEGWAKGRLKQAPRLAPALRVRLEEALETLAAEALGVDRADLDGARGGRGARSR